MLIVGAGGFAREVFTWFGEVGCKFYTEIETDPDHIHGNKVIKNREELTHEYNYIIAIGNSQARERLYKELSFLKLRQALNASGRRISSKNVIGDGSIICPGAVISIDCSIGKNTIINYNATIGHDCVIGNNVTISPGANISGHVIIGDNSFIGAGACIREGVVIGSNSTIGIGSVILKNVPSNETHVGNPGRKL